MMGRSGIHFTLSSDSPFRLFGAWIGPAVRSSLRSRTRRSARFRRGCWTSTQTTPLLPAHPNGWVILEE